MKFFSVILLFLILALAVMPCGEEPEVEKGNVELSSPPIAGEHDAPEDSCNAFCHCARCPFSVIIPETSRLVAHKTLTSVCLPDRIPAVRDVSFAIWQPPPVA